MNYSQFVQVDDPTNYIPTSQDKQSEEYQQTRFQLLNSLLYHIA